MLTERQLQRYADVLLWALQNARRHKFKKNDIVLIRYHRPALPLAEILYAKLLRRGYHPIQRHLATVNMERSFFETADPGQLKFIAPGEKELFKHLNGSIFLYAPESITHLSHIDPQKIGQVAVVQKTLRDILGEREDRGDFSWTLCMLPTEELARHAGQSMQNYTRQIVRACFLDRRDPVTQWQQIYKDAMRVKRWLNRMKVDYYHVESADIDLFITPGRQRRWIGLTGHNIPSFELFCSPDWRGTRGLFTADQPSYRSGNRVEGVRLEFRNGRVVAASAQKGEAFLQKQLKMDQGADKIGEFSLTDKRFSKISAFMANTLFDENFGGKYGNCHIAIGSSYSDSFTGNASQLDKEAKQRLGFNDSALHWDLVNTGPKRVTAHLGSGKPVLIYENGRFVH